MKKTLIFIFLATIPFSGYSKVWTLSDANLEIRFKTVPPSMSDK